MSTDVLVLCATAILAVIALTAAVVAVRAAKRIGTTAVPEKLSVIEPPIEPQASALPIQRTSPELAPRVIEGRIIVPPTRDQVVNTAMGRPAVRLNILLYGVAHALRPENRDRIAALMRREYRSRRRQRMQAGRRAVRNAQPQPHKEHWLSELPSQESEATP